MWPKLDNACFFFLRTKNNKLGFLLPGFKDCLIEFYKIVYDHVYSFEQGNKTLHTNTENQSSEQNHWPEEKVQKFAEQKKIMFNSSYEKPNEGSNFKYLI